MLKEVSFDARGAVVAGRLSAPPPPRSDKRYIRIIEEPKVTKVAIIFGTRPEAIKLAPVVKARTLYTPHPDLVPAVEKPVPGAISQPGENDHGFGQYSEKSAMTIDYDHDRFPGR